MQRIRVGREFLKHVRITRPPFAHFVELDGLAVMDCVPRWVSEACIGLEFNPTSLSTDRKWINILPDNWVGALQLQNPNQFSLAAADWINKHVYWGGVIKTSVENVEILGVGRVLQKGQRCYDLIADDRKPAETISSLELTKWEICSAK